MNDFFVKIRKAVIDCRDIFRELFWRRKLPVFFIYGSVLLNAVSWAILWQLTKLNQEIVITHYNAYLGIDMMLNTAEEMFPDLFLATIGGIVVLVLNIFLAGLLLYFSGILDVKDKEKFDKELDVNLLGSNLILSGGFLVQIAIFIYSMAILFVN